PGSAVFGQRTVFGGPSSLVCVRRGEDEQESVDRAGHKSEKGRVVERIDVMEGERG
ncbi:MAG: hypothetical protein LQ341_007151, partial [Variospora aurantia]